MWRLKIKLKAFKRNNVVKFLVFKIFRPKLKFLTGDIEPYLLHFRKQWPFKKYAASEFDPLINEGLNKYINTEEFEYLLKIDKSCFVEPRYGWLVSKSKVYKRSVPYGVDLFTPLPHYIYYKRKNKIKLPAGLPLFYNWFNYWHFYNDIIGSLMVLDKLNFDKAIPVIVPARAKELQYAKDFFETDYAKKWNWLFVGHQDYVYLDKAFIVKSFANVKEQFLLAKEIFKSDRKPGNRKIFLDRLPGGNGRVLQNKDEIIPVIKQFGFEVVTTEGMTVYEQKAIFETASVILGIHGAGLTNMFFRYPEKCTILELFPKGHYPIHYYWLARELGFEYDAICGETNTNNALVLDKNKLIQFLSKH